MENKKTIIVSKISNALTVLSIILSILLVIQAIALNNGNKNLREKCNYNLFDKISCFEIISDKGTTDNYINDFKLNLEYDENILNNGSKN